MSHPRLPNSPGISDGHPLNTKGNLQNGTGDTHYMCDSQALDGQIPPTDASLIHQHSALAEAGLPGAGDLPYIPAG